MSRPADSWGRRLVLLALVVVVVVETAALGWRQWRASRQREAGGSAVEVGRQIAERLGCFGCHGPGGRAPISNPGAIYGSVPDWSDAAAMSLNSPDDVRSWVRDGHPLQRGPDRGALIGMPAYGDLLAPAELDDLVAYVLAVGRVRRPTEALAREGQSIAERTGCFGCHGPEGRGANRNPGSLKGYIPGWDGADFAELVRDRGEFGEWVRDGISARHRSNPLARRFLETQRTRMPEYASHLEEHQIDALWAYIEWLRAGSP